ncbi:MAG: two-component regulator propeller domain-containing protein, partial [Pseudomonadota bacterium]|nr:two-component regulator propeller domain-containing protein [Pseudomonadota bacterium]
MPYRLTHSLSRFLFGLLCCVCATFTYAVTSVNDYFTEVWTSHDGLPHNSVNAIAQTEDGYLWFATWEGVARYNGISFTLFSRDAATGIVDAGTRTLVASSNNQLWVGSARGGLTLREGFNWYPQDVAQGLVNDILEDHQGNLWIAIEGEGVFLRPHLSEKSYGAEQKVLDIGTYRLAQYKDGPIFAATEQGLYRLGSDLATHLMLPDVAPETRVNDLSFDHQGALLIASDLGAWRYDGQNMKRYRNELSNSTITTIAEDNSGLIWLGTLNKGLARLGFDQIEFINTSNGLPNNRVLSWYQDVEGSIWVGTNAGVLRLRSAPFTSITQADGLVGNFARTVLPISGERFIVGTSQGLSVVEDGKASPAASSYSARQSILSLAQSVSGKVYVGTQRAGVYEWFNGDMSPLINRASGLPSDEVRAIYEDSKGALWLGTTS